MKPYKLLLWLVLLGSTLHAQQELIFYQASDFWHANALNPAYFPQDRNVQVGLPAFTVDAWNSGDITFDDFIERKDGQNLLNFDKLINKLEDENDLAFDNRIETFSVGVRLPGDFYVSAGHAVRMHGTVTYPKALPQLLWQGNAPFIGETVEIAPTTLTFGWNEIRLGLAKEFEMVTVGARVNYLSGVLSVESDRSRRLASVYTDPDIYELTLNADYGFWSSSFIENIDTSDLGFEFSFADDVNAFNLASNTGFSFDLGAQARIGDNLVLNGSILDIGGRINWDTDDSYYFRSEGSYLYTGGLIDGKSLLEGTDSLDFELDLDTLNDIFAFSRDRQTFSSSIPTRFYLGGSYVLTEDWTVQATFFHQSSKIVNQTAVGVGVRWDPLYWLNLGAMYSINNRSAANLGFYLGLRPGPVQFYFASDNILTAFQPYASLQVNLRAGMSLAFGKREVKGQPGVPFDNE